MNTQTERTQPTALHPNDAALQALAEARAAAIASRTAADCLLELERMRNTPPEVRPLFLSAADPRQTDRSYHRSASIGIYNANPVVIYTSLGGVSAAPGRGALSVPPDSFVVLPFGMQEVELGVDPDAAALADGSAAVVYLFRYLTVQPGSLSR
jgi:hypothetical protein